MVTKLFNNVPTSTLSEVWAGCLANLRAGYNAADNAKSFFQRALRRHYDGRIPLPIEAINALERAVRMPLCDDVTIKEIKEWLR